MENPERFDPREGAGRLIDSEHQARYRWASRLVAGKEVLDAACGVGYGLEILASAAKAVTGLDIDPEAVAEAEKRHGKSAKAVVQGDLLELPFEAGSFDVVTCFEAIEHVEDHEAALAEVRRVLRPDGVLVLSTPNPEAYLEGNEYHLREFRPEELLAAVAKHFAHAVGHRQDAWVGSRIGPAGGGGGAGAAAEEDVIRTAADPASADFGIVVASDSELPEIPALLAVGETFDLRWWSEQVANREREIERQVERERATRSRLYEVEHALLEANQELSQVLLFKHRLESLEAQHAELAASYHELLASRSWRITKPLRRGA
jgi:SAM-dependent methyltransferase